jgi:hypothetical protein
MVLTKQMFWKNIYSWLELYMAEAFLSLAAICLLLMISCIIFLKIATTLKKRYKALMVGREGVNIEELLNRYGGMISQGMEKQRAFELRLAGVEEQLRLSVSGVGLVRFNAFQETGSDLSFSLALLDRCENGVVVTSIFGREDSRCYGKPILAGQSSHLLSEEEMKALADAKRGMKL